MKVSIIAAVADNGVIGLDNGLPWHLSADLQRFKRLTMGHHLLIGRKTFAAIGRSLPGRSMVVISRGRPTLPAGVALTSSLEEAIELARGAQDTEAFVAGGAQIYALALPLADRLYLTRIHATFAGDAFFPDVDLGAWKLIDHEDHRAADATAISYSFLTYERP
jgi:dihydrofolate reductase